MDNPYVSLARLTVESFVRDERLIDPSVLELPEGMRTRKAAFTTIKKDGVLRGCIGTVEPMHSDLAHEIVANAYCAAFEDPRFPSVHTDELAELTYSVDVVYPPEKVSDVRMLDPSTYGIIVTSGVKKGVLLPMIEGVDTAFKQLEITLEKAGIDPREPYVVERFKVMRHQ